MKYQLFLDDSLREFIRCLPPHLKRKIKQAFKDILEEPNEGKPLKEDLQGLMSYRLGNIRIIYKVEGGKIHMIALGPRKDIYTQVALEIRRKKESE